VAQVRSFEEYPRSNPNRRTIAQPIAFTIQRSAATRLWHRCSGLAGEGAWGHMVETVGLPPTRTPKLGVRRKLFYMVWVLLYERWPTHPPLPSWCYTV
jgi:hypothetical protein